MSSKKRLLISALAAVAAVGLFVAYALSLKAEYARSLANLEEEYKSAKSTEVPTAEERIEVPSGLVAVTVSSTNILSVGGSLEPGSIVNVYASSSDATSLIGEGIYILETSASSSDSESSITWVTLAVTPESVEEVIRVSETSTLYFTLPSHEALEATSEVSE